MPWNMYEAKGPPFCWAVQHGCNFDMHRYVSIPLGSLHLENFLRLSTQRPRRGCGRFVAALESSGVLWRLAIELLSTSLDDELMNILQPSLPFFLYVYACGVYAAS